MLSGKFYSRAFPTVHGHIRWGASLFMALCVASQISAHAQNTAQQPAATASDVCAGENFADRVTPYLIQRCFDENSLFELRRAIQRRQLQLDDANQRTATELMEKLGINRAVLNSLLLIMSEAEVDIENQAEILAESLVNYRILSRDLNRLNANDQEGHDFAQIAAEIEKGDWTAASKLALVMETRALAQRRQNGGDENTSSAREAIAEFLLGQIALVRASYTGAARHFEVAALYAGRTTPEGQAFSEAAADALFASAKRNWNERLLQEAVDIYRRVLDVRPRSSHPELWAQTQNKLGNAILRLGVGSNSVPLMTGAVSAFEAALEVQIRDLAPRDWAATTANLADALVQLGNRLNEEKDLRDAVDAYKRLLAETSFEDDPGRWVELQTSLGNALWSLGRQESGPDALTEAIAVFEEALKGIDRDRQLRDWGATQNNIGAAYFLLSERVSPVDNATKAVAAFEASLAAYRDASAVYFITGVRKNLAGAQALLQRSIAEQPPERTRTESSVENSSSPPIR
jgi:hypothetical protein